MRIVSALFAIVLTVVPVFAADTDGRIASVDRDQMTITLENGETYKLPAEIDMTAVAEGMEVVIAYRDVGDGVKQITDMVLPE